MRARPYLPILIVIVAGSMSLLIYQWVKGPPPFLPLTPPEAVQGFEPPNLPISEAELREAITSANSRSKAEYQRAANLRRLSNAFAWGGTIVVGLVGVVAAWKGKSAPVSTLSAGADANSPATRADVDATSKALQEDQTAATNWLVRVVAVLVSLSTFSNVAAQRLDADATRHLNAGVEVNKAVLRAIQLLHDPATSRGTAYAIIQELKDATARPW